MRRYTIPIGRVLGIPLELDYSWFLVFAPSATEGAVRAAPGDVHAAKTLHQLRGQLN